MHLFSALQDQASDVLHRDPKGVMYKETIRTNEDRFGDQYLAVGYPSQLKTWTQGNGEHLQEFATTIEQFTLFVFPALHEDHFCRRASKAFGNDIRDQGIKQQVLLGGKRTINETFRQTLELEVLTLAVWSSFRLQKTSHRTLWKCQPSPKRKKKLLTVYMPAR
jgi:hypothetical protein